MKTRVASLGRSARSAPALLLCLAPLAACGAPAAQTEALGHASEPIVNGVDSTAAQNAVVRIVGIITEDGQEGGFSCTGALLAPNLVITARHCVSNLNSDSGFACDDQGNVVSGDASIGADFDPTAIFIQVGLTLASTTLGSTFSTGDAHGTQIFHDSSTVLCNHDQALILLDHKIAGAQYLPIRLETFATDNETFTAVGWGVTTTTDNPTTRQQRTGLVVDAVGPITDQQLEIAAAPNEFITGEVTCEGDSGGPAISASTGAIIGTVSRGGNGTSDPNDLAAGCTGAGTANLYSQPAGFKAVIEQAYAAAGASVWEEGQPNPVLATFGQPCSSDAACGSGICLNEPNGRPAQCSQVCNVSNAVCPGGYECVEDPTTNQTECVLVPEGQAAPTSSKGGCAAAPIGIRRNGQDGGGHAIFALAGLTATLARRRTRT